MQPYRSFFPHANLLLPQTERVASRVLVLPTGTAVGPEQVAGVCRVIRLVVANAASVNEQLNCGRVPAPVATAAAPTTTIV
jgi:hypothetical protein